jgi:hypothetical protein
MADNTIKKFKHLCLVAGTAWENNLTGAKELEPYLLDILNFTKNEYRAKG